MKRWCALLAAWPAWAAAAVSVVDGSGQTVTLAAPAQRIVSLSPGTTELLFAAGAGAQTVATVEYSDHPAAAKKLPRVGSYTGFSIEAILRLKPDLVAAWQDGGSPRELERLRGLGVPVFISHPLKPGDVAQEMLQLGRLAGQEVAAGEAARQYRAQLAALEARYRRRAPVRVFYQLSAAPIFTISSQSFIDALITLCGGVNVFGQLPQPAPQVSTAAVVAARPQAILAGDRATLAQWDRWRVLPAVAKDARFEMKGDALMIPGPRLAEGAAQLCETLEAARRKLGLTRP